MQEAERGAVMGGLSKAKSGKKPAVKTHSVHIRRADGGGFIAKHEMVSKDGQATGSAEHILPDMAALQGHMQQSMGDQPDAGMAPGGAPSGAPPVEAGDMAGEG